jgi:hypothetical protein
MISLLLHLDLKWADNFETFLNRPKVTGSSAGPGMQMKRIKPGMALFNARDMLAR